jgi:hypothetical protein
MTVQVDYSAFLTDVLPYVRDCPEFVAVNAIRNACIEFCEKSTWWRQSLTEITLVAGQGEYDLDVCAGASIATIISAHLGRQPLMFGTEEKMVETIGPDWRTREGPVHYVVHDGDFNTIRLAHVPDSVPEDTLKLHVALRPIKSSVRVPAELYERWSEVIGFGARARLHDTPGQPYTNTEAAREYRKWFMSGFGDAKIQANRGRSRAPLMVRPPRIV